MPLTRVELDKLVCPCGNRDCETLWLKAHCHRDADAIVSYNQKQGVLTVWCAECKKLIVEITVQKDHITL